MKPMYPATSQAGKAEWWRPDWWPEPVAAIFREALADMGGDTELLLRGPAHIVWADSNFEDEHIVSCLRDVADHRAEHIARVGAKAVDVAARSLERLLKVPEGCRGDDLYCD